MALYPTVIVIHHLLDRFLDLPFALSVLLTNAAAMALVMMVFLPQLSRVLRGWLLPAAPLPAWRNIGVAVLLISVVVGLFMVFSAVFPGSS